MTVAMYNEALQHHQRNADIEQHPSPVERHLISQFLRVEIPGKRDRTVPVLLTKTFKNAIDVLLKYRSTSSDNIFIFSRSSSQGHLRCSDVLRKFSVLCGAKNPETLRSTRLRKHVATISQVANLKENELELLAQFMGHNIKVHREFYSLPTEILQTAKVAKILVAMEKGQQLNLTHGEDS